MKQGGSKEQRANKGKSPKKPHEKRKDEEHWSISILKEKAEQILLQCDKTCDFAISYNDKMWCKPTKICCCRINEKCDEYKGVIKTKMSYEEMKEHYGDADIKGE